MCMINKLKFTKKDVLSEDEFSREKTKVRITTFLDLDVLTELKKRAASSGWKYQTLLNQMVRESLFKEKSIEHDLNRIKRRLSVVERKVG